MKRTVASVIVLLCFATLDPRIAAQQTPEWGSGVAPFAFALIGDMPYGAVRETPFDRLVAEVNRDNSVDFVMHAGDIKAGSERCDDHFFFVDQPLPNLLFSRVQTYGEGLVHWVKIHVDPRSSGVFVIEQKIVRSNL